MMYYRVTLATGAVVFRIAGSEREVRSLFDVNSVMEVSAYAF